MTVLEAGPEVGTEDLEILDLKGQIEEDPGQTLETGVDIEIETEEVILTDLLNQGLDQGQETQIINAA